MQPVLQHGFGQALERGRALLRVVDVERRAVVAGAEVPQLANTHLLACQHAIREPAYMGPGAEVVNPKT